MGEQPNGPELRVSKGGKEADAPAKSPEELRKEQEEAFRKEIESPISKEDAEKALADIEIQLAQLAVQRIRVVAQMDQAKQMLNSIDGQIGMAQLERQVIYRRTLNKEEERG